jgi:hypothetical protein
MLLSPMGPPAGGSGAALQGAQVVPYAPAGRPYMAGHGRVLNALPPAQLPGNATTHAQAVEVVRGMLAAHIMQFNTEPTASLHGQQLEHSAAAQLLCLRQQREPKRLV